MSLLITDSCINCDACLDECPNQSISQGDEYYEINHLRCTECVGHFTEPQCVKVCPANCIIVDPNKIESNDDLFAKYQQLFS